VPLTDDHGSASVTSSPRMLPVRGTPLRRQVVHEVQFCGLVIAWVALLVCGPTWWVIGGFVATWIGPAAMAAALDVWPNRFTAAPGRIVRLVSHKQGASV